MFKAVASSEEPLCLSHSPKGNIIQMLSRHETECKNRIFMKVWFVELEVKCDPGATGGIKKSLGCWRENEISRQIL